MDIKPIISRLAADCDLRTRLLRSVPGCLNGWFLSGSGDLLTEEEANKAYAINFFLDGLDFVSQQIKL